MTPLHHHLQTLTRREMFGRLGTGIGAIALSSLLSRDLAAQPANPLATRRAAFRAASQERHLPAHGRGPVAPGACSNTSRCCSGTTASRCRQHLIEGQRFAFLRGHPNLLGTRFKFQQARAKRAGALRELLPHLAGVADDIAVVKTLHTEEFNHGPAQLFMQTGFGQFGRPSVGSWVAYGLGTENQNLPAFVVLVTGRTGRGGQQPVGQRFSADRASGRAVSQQRRPGAVSVQPGRRRWPGPPAACSMPCRNSIACNWPTSATRKSPRAFRQYELAFRMQTAVPELTDLSREPRQHRCEMYGATPGQPASPTTACWPAGWSSAASASCSFTTPTGTITAASSRRLPQKCREVDKPMAALIRDLQAARTAG